MIHISQPTKRIEPLAPSQIDLRMKEVSLDLLRSVDDFFQLKRYGSAPQKEKKYNFRGFFSSKEKEDQLVDFILSNTGMPRADITYFLYTHYLSDQVRKYVKHRINKRVYTKAQEKYFALSRWSFSTRIFAWVDWKTGECDIFVHHEWPGDMAIIRGEQGVYSITNCFFEGYGALIDVICDIYPRIITASKGFNLTWNGRNHEGLFNDDSKLYYESVGESILAHQACIE